MSRLLSFAVLIAIIIIIGLLFYKVLIGFFIPLFLASVLVVVFRPLHRWVLEKTGHRERLSAVLTTLLILLTLLLPVGLLGTASAVQGLRLVEQNDAQTIGLRISQIRASLGLEMPPYKDSLRLVNDELDAIVDKTSISEQNPELRQVGKSTTDSLIELKKAVQAESGEAFDARFNELIDMAKQVGLPNEEVFGATNLAVDLKSKFSNLRTALLGGSFMAFAREYANPTKEQISSLVNNSMTYLRPRLLSLTGATGTFIAKLIFGGIIMVVSTFFFLYDGPAMIKNIMYLSPLDDKYEKELLLEFDRIARAVVLATVLSAAVQGLTAGIGYYFAGMEYLMLLTMLTTAFAMVPFVGPAIIWIPVCLYLAMNDRAWAAALLAIWGVAVVGTIDNFVKAFVLHGQSQLHPLLALLSVLGGVQAMGAIGIVVGPMVIAMLQTLLSILQRELVAFEIHRHGPLTGMPPTSEFAAAAEQPPNPAASAPPTPAAPAPSAPTPAAPAPNPDSVPDAPPEPD